MRGVRGRRARGAYIYMYAVYLHIDLFFAACPTSKAPRARTDVCWDTGREAASELLGRMLSSRLLPSATSKDHEQGPRARTENETRKARKPPRKERKVETRC